MYPRSQGGKEDTLNSIKLFIIANLRGKHKARQYLALSIRQH